MCAEYAASTRGNDEAVIDAEPSVVRDEAIERDASESALNLRIF